MVLQLDLFFILNIICRTLIFYPTLSYTVNTLGQNVYTPQILDLDDKRTAKSFEATRYSSYILHFDGSVNSCGRNFFGQLGDSTNEDSYL